MQPANRAGRSPGRRRSRTPVRAAAAALVVGLVVLAAWAVRHRSADGAWPWQDPGPRIAWCGRHFDRLDDRPVTAAVARDQVGAAEGSGRFRVVGGTGVGGHRREIWAAPLGSARLQDGGWLPQTPGAACAMTVFLRTGPDAFTGYGLVGGP